MGYACPGLVLLCPSCSILSVAMTCPLTAQEAVYGPDHDEPTEQGAVRKTAAKRKAPEPDPAAEAALAAINYKACAVSSWTRCQTQLVKWFASVVCHVLML